MHRPAGTLYFDVTVSGCDIHPTFGLADVNAAVPGAQLNLASCFLDGELAVTRRRAQPQSTWHGDRIAHREARVVEASVVARALAAVHRAARRAACGLLHAESDVARVAAAR